MKNINRRKPQPSFYLKWMVFGILTFTICSCKKYLEAKPDQSIATPSTIDDLEGILNNYTFMNSRYPSASEVASDSYYLSDGDYAGLNERQRNFYVWNKYDDIGADYVAPYTTIAYANVILETVEKVSSSTERKKAVKGSALFIRAASHFALSQLFAKAYDPATANDDLGIALRLTSDAAEKPVRSSVTKTYASIIADLKESINLLPSMPDLKFKPGKAASYGMLARVYLSMRDYPNAGLYADSSLMVYDKLIDYNTLSTGAAISFKQFNDEVVYDAKSSPPAALTQAKAHIDDNLYSSYAGNDLRKLIYFKSNANGTKAFKANYTGLSNASVFFGVATDEMFLISAECAARIGNMDKALQMLNALLITRWKKGTYIPVTLSDSKQLTQLVLEERKKELLFRGLRWIDLRRLNKEPDFAQSIFRKLNDGVVELKPGSDRFVFEIDRNAVNISGMIQNP